VSVAELVPDARVVRSRTGIVAALRELAGSVDARAHAEALRLRLARANDDVTLSAGVGGPKRGTTGAHLALLQAEQAVVIGRAMRGDGAVTMFEDRVPQLIDALPVGRDGLANLYPDGIGFRTYRSLLPLSG